jgi:hypothetical protein
MRKTALLFFALVTMSVGITAALHRHAWAAEEGAADGADDDAEGGKSKAPKGPLPDWFNRQSREYFTMPPFNIPVIGDNAVSRQVTFLVTLQTMGIDNKDKVISHRRQLQDGFFRDIYGVMAFRQPANQSYNLDVIKTRLKRVGDQLVGAGVIDDIVVKSTYERDLNTSSR